jgi:hypothetical protein
VLTLIVTVGMIMDLDMLLGLAKMEIHKHKAEKILVRVQNSGTNMHKNIVQINVLLFALILIMD